MNLGGYLLKSSNLIQPSKAGEKTEYLLGKKWILGWSDTSRRRLRRWRLGLYPEEAIKALRWGITDLGVVKESTEDREDIKEVEKCRKEGKPLPAILRRYKDYTSEQLRRAGKVIKEEEALRISSAKSFFKEMVAELKLWRYWQGENMEKRRKWWMHVANKYGYLNTLKKEEKPFPKNLDHAWGLNLQSSEATFRRFAKEDSKEDSFSAKVYEISDMMVEYFDGRLKAFYKPDTDLVRKNQRLGLILQKFGMFAADWDL